MQTVEGRLPFWLVLILTIFFCPKKSRWVVILTIINDKAMWAFTVRINAGAQCIFSGLLFLLRNLQILNTDVDPCVEFCTALLWLRKQYGDIF